MSEFVINDVRIVKRPIPEMKMQCPKCNCKNQITVNVNVNVSQTKPQQTIHNFNLTCHLCNHRWKIQEIAK
jgi:hypothetical protein